MHLRKILPVILTAAVLLPLSGRGTDEIPENTADGIRIVQAGSAAFMVQNALYLFPEAYGGLVAAADGNQGNGSFMADLDPGAGEKTILPRTANTEAVLALRPDVVVMKNFMRTRMGAPLEQMGIDTFYLDLESPEAWMADLAKLGDLFDNPERAAELQELFRERIETVTGAFEGMADREKPSTLFLYWSVRDGVSAVNVPPVSWIQTSMVEMAGGNPVWKDAELSDRWTKVGLEQIAAWNPDHIVVAAYHVPTPTAVEAIKSDPLWSSLKAVRAGNVHGFPVDYHSWDQPDARWLLGLTWLAAELHPERFPGLEMESEARAFYRDFFFMDDKAYDRMILPRLNLPD